MIKKLEEAFEKMGVPYYRQGSYGGNEESYFTFWNIRTPEKQFYDNAPHGAEWKWAVYFYTRKPQEVYTKVDELSIILKEKGFIVDGRGFDIPSDEPGYIGRYITATYVEHYGGAENE